MMVVGQYPTAGAEAEVSRGQFMMPEGMSLQVPFGRFVLPDGSLFLEGQGVKPTIKVSVDASNAASTSDVVLNAAVAAILGQASASTQGSAPSVPVPSLPTQSSSAQASGSPTPAATLQPAASAPTIDTVSQSQAVAASGIGTLESKASEQYPNFPKPGTQTYTVTLAATDQILWASGWCATTSDILTSNLKNMQFKFTLDGKDVSLSDFATADGSSNGQQCHEIFVALGNWPVGKHHITTTVTYTVKINDGISDYAPGNYISDYTVNVQP